MPTTPPQEPDPMASPAANFLRTAPFFSAIYGAGRRGGQVIYRGGQAVAERTGIQPTIPKAPESGTPRENPVETLTLYPVYEAGHRAAEWWNEQVASPFAGYVTPLKEKPGLGQISQLATGLVRSPGLVAEFGGMILPGAERLGRETIRTPTAPLGYLAAGIVLQGKSIEQGARERPWEFAGEMVGQALITEGMTRGIRAGRPFDISRVDVPTGRMLPERNWFGRRTGKIVAETNRYTVLSGRNPFAPIESRLFPLGGIAKTADVGRVLFKGSPAKLASERSMSVYSPFELEKARPWTEGEWAVIGKTIMKKSPEVGEILYTTQESLRSANRFSKITNKQIETFRPPLKAFTPEAMDVGLKVISQRKYRGNVVVGGSVSMQSKIRSGGYRDITRSDVDVYVKKSLMKNLYTDMVREMAKKQPEIATNPETYYKEGSFQIKGNPRVTDITGKQVKGIHALPLEDFPVVAEKTSQQWVKIQSGGKVKIPSTPYQLASKTGGSFQKLYYKPGEGASYIINRAKDVPDVFSLSSQSAANIYGKNIKVDILKIRTRRATGAAGSLAKTADQFRGIGKSTGISSHEGVPIRQTTGPMFKEITNPPLRGVERTITPAVNIQAKHIAAGAAAGVFLIGGPGIPLALKGAVGVVGMIKLKSPELAPYIQKGFKSTAIRTSSLYGGQKGGMGYKASKAPTSYYQKTPIYSQYKTAPYTPGTKYAPYKAVKSLYKPMKTGYISYKPVKTPGTTYTPYKTTKTPTTYTPGKTTTTIIPKTPKTPKTPRTPTTPVPPTERQRSITWLPEKDKKLFKRIASVKDLGWKITNPVPNLRGFGKIRRFRFK